MSPRSRSHRRKPVLQGGLCGARQGSAGQPVDGGEDPAGRDSRRASRHLCRAGVGAGRDRGNRGHQTSDVRRRFRRSRREVENAPHRSCRNLFPRHGRGLDAVPLRHLRHPLQRPQPGEFDAADLARDFDVIVFPDADEDVLTKGKYKRGDRYVVNDYPPQFRKPISKKGLAKLTAFIQGGGTVRIVGRVDRPLYRRNGRTGRRRRGSETVELPVRDISDDLDEVLVPGAFLAVDYLPGPPAHLGHARAGRRILSWRHRSLPLPSRRSDTDRRVMAIYPERDLLLSGYLRGEKELQNNAGRWCG